MEEEYPLPDHYSDFSEHSGNEEFAYVVKAMQFPHGEHVLLPDCEGPKLHPFRPSGRVENLEWVYEVAVTKFSAVWKISIDGVFYALKIFGFALANDIGAYGLPPEEVQSQIDHSDSFNCECRAYGRIYETGHGDLVVRCHGYVLLTPQQERAFRSRTSECPSVLRRYPDHAGIPLRCILKDWVEEGTEHFTAKMALQMKRDLKTLNGIGIINRDIKRINYMGGKLVDFGIAWTVPHYELDRWKELVAQGGEQAESAREELEIKRG